MGNSDSKLNFRKAVIQLTTKTQVMYFYMYCMRFVIQYLCIEGSIWRVSSKTRKLQGEGADKISKIGYFSGF